MITLYTGIGKWFELGGNNNNPHKNKYFSPYFTPDLLSKLFKKSRGATTPLTPLLPTPML